ncbi:MAG: iron-siderophore ABC transporter substrate-binding protein [Calothrix sp. C42_A2020_038]|nr:iron-siderophore ABC transporter substrate-binding protein [Calothrix sp. C42_A2020_038]
MIKGKPFGYPILLLLLGFLMAWLMVACHPSSPKDVRRSISSGSDCYIMQHSLGKACIPKDPQRVVALNPSALGNAIALGIKPIASVFEYDHRFPFPNYLQDKTKGIELLGIWAEPSIERMILLKPDVMIGWQHNHQAIYPQLSAIAPTVFYDWLDGNRRDDQQNWKWYFNFMAKVLNRQEAAAKVWQHYQQRVEKLKTALGDRYRHKTISFIFFCCGGILSEQSFAGSVLSDVGLQGPPSQQGKSRVGFRFSEESLDMVDGDVMFVAVYGGRETGERDFKRLQKNPLWAKLKVVQQKRVYSVDPTAWRGRTPLAADVILDDLEKYLINTP